MVNPPLPDCADVRVPMPVDSARPRIIGVEEHFLTPAVRQAWERAGLDAVDPSVAFHSGAVEHRLLDLAGQRLAPRVQQF